VVYVDDQYGLLRTPDRVRSTNDAQVLAHGRDGWDAFARRTRAVHGDRQLVAQSAREAIARPGEPVGVTHATQERGGQAAGSKVALKERVVPPTYLRFPAAAKRSRPQRS
jgi:hypothetical protein